MTERSFRGAGRIETTAGGFTLPSYTNVGMPAAGDAQTLRWQSNDGATWARGPVFDNGYGNDISLLANAIPVDFFAPSAAEYAARTCLDDAITALGSTNQHTLLIPNPQTVSANLTITSNITLVFLGSGRIDPSAGVTVTINGKIIAPYRKIFGGAGTIAIGSGSVDCIVPQWWGAVGDGVTDDTSALTAWLAALGSGNYDSTIVGVRRGFLPAGKYVHTSTLAIPNSAHVFGVSLCSVFLPTSAISTAVTQATGSVLEGVVIDGRNAGSGKIGLSIGAASLVNDGVTRDVICTSFTGVNGRGGLLGGAINWRLDTVGFWDNEDGLHVFYAPVTAPNNILLSHCTFKSNDGRGLYQQSGQNYHYDTCLFEQNGTYGIYLDNTGGYTLSNINFTAPYLEANQLDFASGAARHAEYQVYCQGTNITLNSGFFFGGGNDASALKLENAVDYVVDNPRLTNLANLISLTGTSRGSFLNWQQANGEFNTTVNDAAAGARFNDSIESTFTPVLTFATPGNLNVVYGAQTGRYTRINNRVIIQIAIETTTFTHTTASGALRITGLPYSAVNASNVVPQGGMTFQGITKAGYTQIAPTVSSNYVNFVASGSGVGASNVVAADVPSGGTVILYVSIVYEIA